MSDNMQENTSKDSVEGQIKSQASATDGNQSSSNKQGSKQGSKQGLLGLGLVGIGLLAVLTNIGDEAGFLWTGMISAIMFFAYYRTKAYGLLIPACILAGVTAGIIFELLSPVEGVFLLGLGGGFIAIDRIQQEKSRWPLYPGIVLLAIGTVITIQTLFNNMLFAIMLIVVGAFLLLRNRQVLDSMVDVKADIDIRVGDHAGEDSAKADLKAESTKTFASDDLDASLDASETGTNEVSKVEVSADSKVDANKEETSAAAEAQETKVVDIMPESKSDETANKAVDDVIEIDVKSTDPKNVQDLDDAVSNIKKAVDKIVEDANLPKDDGISS